MLYTVLTLSLIALVVVLGTLVATRAWQLLPSRLFVLLCATIATVLAATLVRDSARSLQSAFPVLVILVASIVAYVTVLFLMVSALFVPEWWEGSRPILIITAPFVAVLIALLLDMLTRQGIFVGEVYDVAGMYRFRPGRFFGAMVALSTIASLFPLLICLVSLRRYPQYRLIIGLLAGAILLSILISGFFSSAGSPTLIRYGAAVQTIPIVIVLTYAILGTQLFLPTRAALDQALHALGEAVAVVDEAQQLVFVNPEAMRLGLQNDRPLVPQLASLVADSAALDGLVATGLEGQNSARQTLSIGRRSIDMSLTPVRDRAGRRRGTLVLGRDISELLQRSAALEQERRTLNTTVELLQREQREREHLATTVRELSLPLIPVLPGVIVMPLIGDFDQERLDEFISVLLRGVEQEQADTVMIDITGLSLLDTQGARGLLDAVQSARLLGAECVLVGVRPEIAQSIVSLGLVLDDLAIAQSLQQALAERIARSGTRRP